MSARRTVIVALSAVLVLVLVLVLVVSCMAVVLLVPHRACEETPLSVTPGPCLDRGLVAETETRNMPVWTFGGSGKDASYDGGGVPVVQPQSPAANDAALPVSIDPQIAHRLESGMSSPPSPSETPAGRCQYSADEGMSSIAIQITNPKGEAWTEEALDVIQAIANVSDAAIQEDKTVIIAYVPGDVAVARAVINVVAMSFPDTPIRWSTAVNPIS